MAKQAMNPQRWREIEDLYHAARDLKPAARAALLDGTDSEIRNEVESLLAHLGSLPDIALPGLSLPGDAVSGIDAEAGLQLEPGTRIGSYRIDGRLGIGGMGEVYRAHDTELDRPAAIKILPAAMARDPERLARFEREARMLASLNHPNIAQVYGIVEGSGSDSDGLASWRIRGIAMELVPGANISGPMPLDRAMECARQIASALEAAHARGIVHRDLKPANIMVTPEGVIKLLDFGLARLSGNSILSGSDDAGGLNGLSSASPQTGESADQVDCPTRAGMILGTAAYMSPEQARGQVADKRADIWAFGVVLYEMVAGKRLFGRATVADSLTAVLSEQPDLMRVPEKLRRLLAACLEKDARKRLRDIADWEHLIEDERAAAVASISSKRRPVASIAALTLMAVALALLIHHPAPVDLSTYKFTSLTSDEAGAITPVWSPDGKSLAYILPIHGITQLFTKAPGAKETTQLTHAADSCEFPFWSSDAATVYYRSAAGLWAVRATGGAPELVMEGAGAAALHPNGKTLVFARGGNVFVTALQGGMQKELSGVPHMAGSRDWMKFSPDGSTLALGSSEQLWVRPWPSGPLRNLGEIGKYGADWFPDGKDLVFSGTGSDELTVIDADDGSRRVIYRAMGLGSLSNPSVSPDGKKIAYSGGVTGWSVVEISLPEGRAHTMPGGGRLSYYPDWAPSGNHYLVSSSSDAGGNPVLEDRSEVEGFSRRLDPAGHAGTDSEAAPRWAPDGKRFLFLQGGQIKLANISGGRLAVLANVGGAGRTAAWSPDGQWIAFLRVEGGKQQLAKMRPAEGAAPELLAKAAPRANGYSMIQWSPAGDWIAYPSAEGISVISPDGSNVRRLTARRLQGFAFSKDGMQVYGIARNTTGDGPQWQLYSIDVKKGMEKLLASLDLPVSTGNIAGFSMHPDGKRFLTSIAKWPFDVWMLEGFEAPGPKNWFDRLFGRSLRSTP